MRIEILDEAQDDLIGGFRFYDSQSVGLGRRFLDSLFADIDSLQGHGGDQARVLGVEQKAQSACQWHLQGLGLATGQPIIDYGDTTGSLKGQREYLGFAGTEVMTLRLRGIDAPELPTQAGVRAREFV